jgi:hypothetical protein
MIAAFPFPDYYLDETAIAEAIADRNQFNLVDVLGGMGRGRLQLTLVIQSSRHFGFPTRRVRLDRAKPARSCAFGSADVVSSLDSELGNHFTQESVREIR